MLSFLGNPQVLSQLQNELASKLVYCQYGLTAFKMQHGDFIFPDKNVKKEMINDIKKWELLVQNKPKTLQSNIQSLSPKQEQTLQEVQNHLKKYLASKVFGQEHIINEICRITNKITFGINKGFISEDYVAYGFTDQFTNRFDKKIYLNKLTRDNLLDIIQAASSNNVVIDSVSTISKSEFKIITLKRRNYV